jgi:hypothetical protein
MAQRQIVQVGRRNGGSRRYGQSPFFIALLAEVLASIRVWMEGMGTLFPLKRAAWGSYLPAGPRERVICEPLFWFLARHWTLQQTKLPGESADY